MLIPLLLTLWQTPAAIRVEDHPTHVLIETDCLWARVNKQGYVSGLAAGSFVDKKSKAKDIGFGLHIMDFLLAPGWRDDGYERTERFHGQLAKHYVEGPQICTKGSPLEAEIVRGEGFAAVRLTFKFHQPGKGYKSGSTWRQTLLFKPGLRYFFSSEEIVSANECESLFYRIDMPGHIKHKRGDSFSHIYLSYGPGLLAASEFAADFAPDKRFLYQREEGKIPRRMIRAYRPFVDGQPGPWLAGMTLDPAAVSEAWCHQRGYVCFIQELHGRATRLGERFGAAYLVGWFDSIAEMELAYDRHKGASSIVFEAGKPRLAGSDGR